MKVLHAVAVMSIGACALGLATAFAEDAYPNRPIRLIVPYGAGGAWFEGADYPVLATASADDETAFVRVLLLPPEWAGKRTIRYVDPADEEKPRLQRPTVLLEAPL